MADLEEIVENHRTNEGGGSRNEDESDLTLGNSTKQKGKCQDSRGSQNPSQTSSEEQRKPPQHADRSEQGEPLTQGDHQAEFYKAYYRVAEEHDKELLKNRIKDLDILLIFAGLFSAIITAFITRIDSQLKPDPGDETNALLRVLIYKIDNTTFGDDVPTLPQATGPPSITITAQNILFASLGVTLLCASLAMYYKNSYGRRMWTGMLGSIVERGQNRQHNMDDSPLYLLRVVGPLQAMLQFSLLLFVCGVLRSLKETNKAAVPSFVAAAFCALLFFTYFEMFCGGSVPKIPQSDTGSLSEAVRLRALPRSELEWRSISWILRTSLDEAVRLSAFKYLMSIPELPKQNFNPTLVVDCLHVFVSCISLTNGKVVIRQGLERLATASAGCFFRTFHHLSVTSPTSNALRGLRHSYGQAFPLDVDFRGLPFHHTMTMIHILIKNRLSSEPVEWDNDKLSTQGRVPLAWYMAEAAQIGYQQTKGEKVPRWILRFALDSLSLDPPSPPPVVADCLKVIAIDLGCDISTIATAKESERVGKVSGLITQKLKNMVEATNPHQIFSKRKAISALFPYAISLGPDGHQGMADEILRIVMIPYPRKVMWRHMEATLFADSSSPSLNRAIALVSPYLAWIDASHDQSTVNRWAAATLAVPYTEEVGQSIVDVLLQISSNKTLRPHIPDNVWAFLKKRVSIPPTWRRRSLGTGLDVVFHIRGLGDVDILKSYYLLVWSEWDFLSDPVVSGMEISMKEDFGGVGMRGHREDLIARLDHVLAQLNRGPEYFDQEKPGVGGDAIEQAKERYTKLRDALLKLHIEGT